MDKRLIITKLVLQRNQFRPMIIKPLTQLAELMEDALSSVANLSKFFRTFIIETWNFFLHLQDA